MTVNDVQRVPLPESMHTCGCPHAPRMHKTTCAAAIALAAIPLQERDGYQFDKETGRSNTFEGFSWDHPYRISAPYGSDIDIGIDIDSVILKYADAYRQYHVDEQMYEAWEKPWLFIHDEVMEQMEFGGVDFGGHRFCIDRSSGPDYLELHPRWTPEDTERVEALLAALPDPNQTTLDV